MKLIVQGMSINGCFHLCIPLVHGNARFNCSIVCGNCRHMFWSYIRSYVNVLSATGKPAQDEGNELTRDDFGNGYTFFGFDLTPDGCDGGCFHLVRKGNLPIEIHFAAALAQTVNVVVSTANLRPCSRSTKAATSSTTTDGDGPDRATSSARPADAPLQRDCQRRATQNRRNLPVRFRL